MLPMSTLLTIDFHGASHKRRTRRRGGPEGAEQCGGHVHAAGARESEIDQSCYRGEFPLLFTFAAHDQENAKTNTVR